MADTNGSQASDVPSGLSEVAQEFLSQPEEAQEEILAGGEEKEQPKADAEAETPPEDDADDVSALETTEERAQKKEQEKKKWKLKVNDKEYDVDSEDKLVAAAQRGIAAEQAWQKSRNEVEQLKAQLRKTIQEAEERENLIKNDPAKYLKSLNDKMEDVAEQLLLDRAREALAMENMTPREKELYLQNKQYQERLKQREAEEAKTRTARENELVEQQKKHIGDLFAKALTDAKIPANNTTVRVMAAVYRGALQKGVELTAEQAAKLTRKHLDEIASHASAPIEEIPAADFVSKYPKLTEAIRKHLVEKARTKPAEATEVPRQQRTENGQFKKKNAKLDSGKSWDDMIEKLKKEGAPLVLKSRFGY